MLILLFKNPVANPVENLISMFYTLLYLILMVRATDFQFDHLFVNILKDFLPISSQVPCSLFNLLLRLFYSCYSLSLVLFLDAYTTVNHFYYLLCVAAVLNSLRVMLSFLLCLCASGQICINFYYFNSILKDFHAYWSCLMAFL